MRTCRARAALCLLALAALVAACGSPFGPDYEYEEQLYLSVDGEASAIVNASVAALVALRGAALDPADADVDRDAVRRLFEDGGCEVDSVSRGWERDGRRFVQVRISAAHVRTLDQCSLLAWSSYSLDPAGEDHLRFIQTVGAPPAGTTPAVNWDGSELVAFRLHAPSRVFFHNIKQLDGSNGAVARGNILTWEQRLADRLAGVPVELRVDMGSASILNTAVLLFVGAFAAAVVVLATLIWITVRRGRQALVSSRTETTEIHGDNTE